MIELSTVADGFDGGQMKRTIRDHDEEHTMNESLPEVYLARHGETAWSLSGRHTGRTDIPLTERGEDNARWLRGRLEGITFTEVLVSPLQRARRTCELAGFAAVAKVTPDLIEWDYGDYEGRLTSDIRRERPGWYLFRDGCPGGESLAEVGARADRVVARLRADGGRILLFGHGHFSRDPRRALDGPDRGGREAPRAQYRIAEHRGLRAYPGRPGHRPLER